MQKNRGVLLFIVVSIYFTGIFYISGFISVVSFFTTLLLYGVIFYLITKLWKYLRKKGSPDIIVFFQKFILGVLIFLSIFTVTLICFSIYQNIISPAYMPIYTLTNGEKVVKFQTMSHVGSPEFYNNVQQNIQNSKQNNFVLFYEGVRPGSPENMQAFSEALGVDIDENLYENFGKLYGVVAQNNNDFLNIKNNRDFNIDLSIDEIMSIYTTKIGDTPVFDERVVEIPDLNTEILEFISQLNSREFKLLQFINQALMNCIIKNKSIMDSMITQLGNTDIFSVILDERDKHLAENILQSDFEDIHIIYGLMHFEGVLRLLQANNPNWEIIETQYMQLISGPE